jgi:hypothetical protein
MHECGSADTPCLLSGCQWRRRELLTRRETLGVAAEVHHLPIGRLLSVDERGIGLRATWHLDHGFLNTSLWRHDVCVETFHLTTSEAARLATFIAEGLFDAAAHSVAT